MALDAREELRRSLAARRIHAHVERTVVLEAEAARSLAELRRRHAEVEQNAVDFRRTTLAQYLVQATEAVVRELQTFVIYFSPRRDCRWIAIQLKLQAKLDNGVPPKSTQAQQALVLQVNRLQCQAAKSLNISYTSFRRTFREHTGASPHQYRLHLKIRGARELLRSTDLRVKEISYRCGFDDEQYFCRIFKRQTGNTPVEFRARSRRPKKPGSL